ncbi:hypothetical protein C5Y98_05075 [Blastopirellula marina]|uniref:Cytochrome c domain-containing protein n=2 Tax=Blastopirellula marina TaxID=124 RepID=A0A2S8G966_9BACT|nr:hypothetical protein C5Y98_05075 [Blastopirellula marina]
MFVDSLQRYYLGVVLHRHNTTPGYDAIYNDLTTPLEMSVDSRSRIRRMLKQRNLSFVSQLPLKLVGYKKDLQYAIAERNPPQLYGVDLIDKNIKDSDLLAIAESQKGSSSGVSGRFTGRYGWRGQMNDLDMFIKGACAAELGLQVAEMNQAPNPMKLDYHIENPDLDSQQTSNLIAYVRSLPRPEMVMPDDPNERSYVSQGKLLFSQVGCAECHVENVGSLNGIYSDFLLHNMGSSFEDPIPAKQIPSYVVTAGISDVFIETGGEDRYKGDKAAAEKYNTEGRAEFEANKARKIKIYDKYLAENGMPPYYGIDPRSTQFSPQAPPNPYSTKYDDHILAASKTIRFNSIEEQNHYKEYRTPALWGVADSAPYLHDGRADTLRAAIEWHGGEAYASMMRFSQLSEEQQTSVLKFLKALKAPKTAENVPDQIADDKKTEPAAGDKISALSPTTIHNDEVAR